MKLCMYNYSHIEEKKDFFYQVSLSQSSDLSYLSFYYLPITFLKYNFKKKVNIKRYN